MTAWLLPAFVAFAVGIMVVAAAFILAQPGQTAVDKTEQIVATGAPAKEGLPDDGQACVPFEEKPYSSETRYEDGTIVVMTNTPVYLMKPGTTGELCIRYTDAFSDQSYSGTIYSQMVARTADAKNVTISPYPDQITEKDHYFASAGDAISRKTSFDIAYTINAPTDSTGFYGVWPMGFCGGLPFAIGYNTSEINYSSDFAWKSGPYYGCSGLGLDKKIVGLSGIDVYYVTNQSMTNIGYEITGVDADVKAESLEDGSSENLTATFTVHFHTYNEAIGVVADARDFEIARFVSNPQLEKIGQCSWVPTNDTALERPEGGSIYDDKFAHDGRHVKIDSRPEKILAHTNDGTYTFNVTLTNLPNGYYALQPAVFVTGGNKPVNQFGDNNNVAGSSIANYFPITVGEMLSSPIMQEQEESESIYGKC